MASDTVTMEMLRGTAVFKEAEERLEEQRMDTRRAAVQKLKSLERGHEKDTKETAQRAAAARAKTEECQKALLNAKAQLGDAEAACLALSCRIDRETRAAQAELKRLLPAGWNETLVDMQQALQIKRNQLTAREFEKRRSWADATPVVHEVSNAPEVYAAVAEMAEAVDSLRRAETELHSTADLAEMLVDARRRFKLDQLPKRQVTIRHI